MSVRRSPRTCTRLAAWAVIASATASIASAQVYDAHDDFWYSGADGNGSPNGITSPNTWAYGTTMTGDDFAPFTTEQFIDLGGGNTLYSHRIGTNEEPVVGVATSAWFADAPPPPYLFVHPGPVAPAIIHWTAPADMTISLAGAFLHPDPNQTSRQDVGIIAGLSGVRTVLMPGTYNSNEHPITRFRANSMQIKAGDTFNFYVGPGDDGFGAEGTGFRAHITVEPTPVIQQQYRLGQSLMEEHARNTGSAIANTFRLGYYAEGGSDSFTLFQRTATADAGLPVEKFGPGDGGSDPNFLFNSTAEAQQFEQFTLEPGAVAAGPYQGPAVARFVAPEAGTYSVSALYAKIQNVNDPAQAQVFVKGEATPVFSQMAGPGGLMYAGTFQLAAGETIDLVTSGSNSGFGNGTTSLSALVTPGVLGDFNGDGAADASDIDQLLKVTGEEPAIIYDVNGDARVVPQRGIFGSDADQWVKAIKHTAYGDADLDGKVSFSDLVKLAQHYNVTSGVGWSDGSFNGDDAVNFADLVILAQNYNFGTGGSSASFAADWALAQSLVPEPTMLGALGLSALLLRRRRRE